MSNLGDLFCAAFFAPKGSANATKVPLSGDLVRAAEGQAMRPGVAELTRELAEEYHFFHWRLAFPEVFARGGFDVVLANPPWDQLVFREQEFFSSVAPEIAQASSASKRTRLINELERNQPKLFRRYLMNVHASEAQREITQGGKLFPLTGRGRSNTFSLFCELNWRIANPSGLVGGVVPSGIATDDTTKFFFQRLIETSSIISLFDFENRQGLFPDIDSRTKFCLFTIRGYGAIGAFEKPRFLFFAQSVSDLTDRRRAIFLSSEDIGLLNPNTKTACVFRSTADSEITLKLCRNTPVLLREAEEKGNIWQINTRPGLFNMAGDSGKFLSRDDLARRGGNLEGNIFVIGAERFLPLYEGKMFNMYDHRAADVVISKTAMLRQGQSEQISDMEHFDPARLPMPRHWVSESSVREQVGVEWDKGWVIGWKEITSPTNERTLIPAVLPMVAIGHKVPIILPSSQTRDKAPLLLACLSSLVCDYVARQKLGTTSLTPYTMKQLPVLPPTRYTYADRDFIFPRVLELTYTAHDLAPFARDLGYDGPPFVWNPERRALLRAELDAYYAKLYGLTRDELRYILDPADIYGDDYPSETFRVLKKNEIREFGEYRTRRLVLEAWDRLATGKLN